MINIRPVSDLRNNYSEIENLVMEDNAVYLTKNGYGSMVVLSLEKYSRLLEQIDVQKAIELKFGNIEIEQILDEIDEEIISEDIKFLTKEETFDGIRRKINGEKV